jgi:hypothetical protein
MRLHPVVILALVFLPGCFFDQNNRQSNEANQQGPIITLPTPKLLTEADLLKDREASATEARAGLDKVRQEIQASSNQTQNQLSGLVTTSISKVAEQVKGVEANVTTSLSAVAKVAEKLEVTNTATAELKAQLSSEIALNASLRVTMENKLQLITDLQIKLGKLESQMGAQLGINNKLENTIATNTSGRDTNYLPKEVVTIMSTREHTFTYVLGGIFALVSCAIGWIGRNSRLRVKQQFESERRERQQSQELLTHVLSMLPESKANEVTQLHAAITEKHQEAEPRGMAQRLHRWWNRG